MPRATTKTDLIVSANEQWEKMWKLINVLPETVRFVEFSFGDDAKQTEAHWKRDKNIRDVLVHVYEWHQLLLKWVSANLGGDAQPFLPEPYNWKTYGEMNARFWEKHQATAYEEAVTMLRDSHNKVMDLIESLTDEELFKKRHFSWTGTTNVGSYCISVTASHYDWAMKKIKLHCKTVGK